MYKLPVIRLILSGDKMYSMMTMVNHAVLYVYILNICISENVLRFHHYKNV